MKRLRIGIDIDGVLYPFNECANEALVDKFGIEDPGPWLYWSYVKDVITREQWAWLWSEEGQTASMKRVTRTYPGVSEAFNAILKSGHECHFVTHRDPRRTCYLTSAFLSYHFRAHPWAGLHVVQNGTAKHSLADWDVFIDDKPETVLAMLKTRAQVFSPVRPWNEELKDVELHSLAWCGSAPRLIRYDDPAKVAEWVLAQ